jgi:hypothetical protein
LKAATEKPVPVLPISRTFGAIYSDCGLYRYRLWRAWGPSGRTILWVMLNPSTADDLGNNDATIERCERRSAAWGFDRMEVVNLFAFRSTEPKLLRSALDPVGPENDRHILEAASGTALILCAWGSHGLARSRSASVRTLFGTRPLHCLGLTRSGEPAHPLYLAYDRTPMPFADVLHHGA